MADILEAKLSSVETLLGASDIYVSARLNKGSRPADVLFRFGGEIVVEKSFSGLRFLPERNGLVPILKFVQWKSLVIAIGLTRMLIFCANPPSVLTSTQLFRAAHEDTGFYSVRADAFGHALIVLYESGTASVSGDGKLLWHREKYWDDIVTFVDENIVVLEDDAGSKTIIDCRTGELRDNR
ncbi:hypothetical protein [Inquilinus limosus]|uniref:hypothetical protein n=1 Tax=Inquilinus limosus TaxID=171674 RepID=UPI0011982239|nr:hypothetical protein [Inquilinus limosus]